MKKVGPLHRGHVSGSIVGTGIAVSALLALPFLPELPLRTHHAPADRDTDAAMKRPNT
ncbi:hypothetical protein [Bradyrhizobium sp. 2TAF24]|uniref:hypothetical protein n=1 Tax=Bradyrhizobium sp. 2TAF24 TaxID=3233011 RepID=UPI003F90A3FF